MLFGQRHVAPRIQMFGNRRRPSSTSLTETLFVSISFRKKPRLTVHACRVQLAGLEREREFRANVKGGSEEEAASIARRFQGEESRGVIKSHSNGFRSSPFLSLYYFCFCLASLPPSVRSSPTGSTERLPAPRNGGLLNGRGSVFL